MLEQSDDVHEVRVVHDLRRSPPPYGVFGANGKMLFKSSSLKRS